MTDALSGEQRTALEKLVQNGRRWFEDDLAGTLSGRYGVNADGTIESVDRLELTNAQIAIHDELVEIVEHLRSEGEDAAGSVDRLVREAAFTHLNRLVAVRVAEAIGLLPETIARGLASSGFRDFSEVAAGAASTDWGRFAVFVGLCGDELARDVPALFDPRNPLLELEPTEAALERFVTAVTGLGADVWAAPDALGWVYQFFNTGEERKAMREGSAAPRNSRELSVRNQFFTPSYVVDFLVHNGLGAYLASGFPGLADELPLLLTPPTERREIDLAAVSVLDPACGSGHFLLGAYDVLERAWEKAGVEPEAAAPAIVASLWGVDIDPRVTQIAQAAIIFRARRHCRTGSLPRPNVVCARALPAGPAVDAFVAALPANVGRAVRAIAEDLTDAPVLGPLLKVEERLDREARDLFGTGVVEGTLSQFAPESSEAAVLEALSAIADSTTSTAGQRLFAAEAHDAVRFVEAMTRRYTAVLMNPPFGDPVISTREQLKTMYPSNSTRTVDLFASFVDRGRQLAQKDGSLGAITTRAGLFLQSYENWRRDVFLNNGSVILADLGFGIMEQAMVEACAYVLRDPASESGSLTVVSVLDATDRPTALRNAIAMDRESQESSTVTRLPVSRLRAIPGSRVAYWAGEVLGALFERLGPLDSGGVVVRRGLQTGDDFRFLRLDWEVGRDAAARERWRPFGKGGPYRPYLPEVHMLADWQADGESIKGFDGSVVPSPQLYFKGGATWTYRTNSAFAPRVLHDHVIFGSKGPGIIGGDAAWLVAYLNSRIAQACVETMVAAGESTTSGSASRSYDTGLVGLIPIPSQDEGLRPALEALWAALVHLARTTGWRTEPLRGFRFDPERFSGVDRSSMDTAVASLELDEVRAAEGVLEAAHRFDCELIEVVGKQAGVDSLELAAVLEQAAGPSLFGNQGQADAESIARYWRLGIEEVIDDLIAAYGGSRNVANLTHHAHRRLEVLAHGLRVSPSSVCESLAALRITSPEFEAEVASSLVSWLVGRCFGHADPSSDGLDDLRRLPDMTGRIEGSPDLLVDQPGHELDLASRFDRIVEEAELEGALSYAMARVTKARSTRLYLRRDYFRQHLARYSMSRRRAPIYWQLQVPSKNWGVWLYYPKLSREMLFAVVGEAEQRLRLAEQQIAHLQREAETGGGGRKAGELAAELEAERKLAVELATFKAEAERIAKLGWEPDLDDGAVLNAAPLADLFPAWKDAADYRKELRAGKHMWATVAQFADQL